MQHTNRPPSFSAMLPNGVVVAYPQEYVNMVLALRKEQAMHIAYLDDQLRAIHRKVIEDAGYSTDFLDQKGDEDAKNDQSE